MPQRRARVSASCGGGFGLGAPAQGSERNGGRRVVRHQVGIQRPPARLALAELQKIVGGFAPPPLGRAQLAATEQHQP